jgi:hypothetical protein
MLKTPDRPERKPIETAQRTQAISLSPQDKLLARRSYMNNRAVAHITRSSKGMNVKTWHRYANDS